MASSVKLPLAFVLLLSGLVVLGEVGGASAECGVRCLQGGYITCENYPGQMLDGCACQCAPPDGQDCILHLFTGLTYECHIPD